MFRKLFLAGGTLPEGPKTLLMDTTFPLSALEIEVPRLHRQGFESFRSPGTKILGKRGQDLLPLQISPLLPPNLVEARSRKCFTAMVDAGHVPKRPN